MAAQEHRSRKLRLPPVRGSGSGRSPIEGQGMDTGTPALLTQMGNTGREQPGGENVRAFLPMAKGGPEEYSGLPPAQLVRRR